MIVKNTEKLVIDRIYFDGLTIKKDYKTDWKA